MSHDPIAQYRRWFEYEKESHRWVLDSFDTIPAEQRTSEPYRKVLAIMGHLVAARRMWLFRLGVTPDRPAELFPTGVTREGLEQDLKGMEQLWDAYLAGLTEQELGRTLEYKSLDAGRFRSTLVDILAQLFGHSSYHRGQVASLVKACGGRPAITDFIFWSREAIPEPK